VVLEKNIVMVILGLLGSEEMGGLLEWVCFLLIYCVLGVFSGFG
jgi:hypothetical protein